MNRGRFVVGVFLLAIGVLLLLQAADLVDAGTVIARWWPILFVVFALLALFDRPPNYWGALVMGVIGVLVLNATADLLPDVLDDLLWPLILVAAGAVVVVNGLRRQPPPAPLAVDMVQATALFSGREISSGAQPFRGGTLLAVFGGVELDLRGASLPPDGAVIDATAVFGGVTVTVPFGWNVVISGPAIFGGTENATHGMAPPDATAPTLTIRSVAVFGGVDAKAAQAVRPVAAQDEPALR